MQHNHITIGDFILSMGFQDWVRGERADYTLLSWPPDVFALTASLLKESGAYVDAARPIPQGSLRVALPTWNCPQWTKRILAAARSWRRMDSPLFYHHLAIQLVNRIELHSHLGADDRSTRSVEPETIDDARRLERDASKLAKSWDAAASMPRRVTALLDRLAQMSDHSLVDLSDTDGGKPLWLVPLELMCIADEASRGAGLVNDLFPPPDPRTARNSTNKRLEDPWRGYPNDSVVAKYSLLQMHDQLARRELYKKYADQKLSLPSIARIGNDHRFLPVTLGWRVDCQRAQVLPKMRTSQRGVTIRSFSLHLSLLSGTSVEPVWSPPPAEWRKSSAYHKRLKDDRQDHTRVGPYNFILLPFPHIIRSSQFAPSTRMTNGSETIGDLDQCFTCLGGRPNSSDRFFEFRHDDIDNRRFRRGILELVAQTRDALGDVHGIILPEMAMTKAKFDDIFDPHFSQELGFIACGVYEPSLKDGDLGKNYVIIRQPQTDVDATKFVQGKHHRWALDAAQVQQYSLGGALKGKSTWWEAIDLPRRHLHFLALDRHVAATVLICEDLARPDPVADVVRAVGPNLVVCLLLDGPQLKDRWSARYATVLTDDPGSSVLTLSSLGMVLRSRRIESLHKCSRVVALWREPGRSAVPLHLPSNSHALAISLVGDAISERTLDGRVDDGNAITMRLAGVQPLSWSYRLPT